MESRAFVVFAQKRTQIQISENCSIFNAYHLIHVINDSQFRVILACWAYRMVAWLLTYKVLNCFMQAAIKKMLISGVD
jgi:hypothetical protein